MDQVWDDLKVPLDHREKPHDDSWLKTPSWTPGSETGEWTILKTSEVVPNE